MEFKAYNGHFNTTINPNVARNGIIRSSINIESCVMLSLCGAKIINFSQNKKKTSFNRFMKLRMDLEN